MKEDVKLRMDGEWRDMNPECSCGSVQWLDLEWLQRGPGVQHGAAFVGGRQCCASARASRRRQYVDGFHLLWLGGTVLI